MSASRLSSRQNEHNGKYDILMGAVFRAYNVCFYRAFHRFGQAKTAYAGLVLGFSQFLLPPQLLSNMMLASKVVKIDLKIIMVLR